VDPDPGAASQDLVARYSLMPMIFLRFIRTRPRSHLIVGNTEACWTHLENSAW